MGNINVKKRNTCHAIPIYLSIFVMYLFKKDILYVLMQALGIFFTLYSVKLQT